jgi:hypothetical protein
MLRHGAIIAQCVVLLMPSGIWAMLSGTATIGLHLMGRTSMTPVPDSDFSGPAQTSPLLSARSSRRSRVARLPRGRSKGESNLVRPQSCSPPVPGDLGHFALASPLSVGIDTMYANPAAEFRAIALDRKGFAAGAGSQRNDL